MIKIQQKQFKFQPKATSAKISPNKYIKGAPEVHPRTPFGLRKYSERTGQIDLRAAGDKAGSAEGASAAARDLLESARRGQVQKVLRTAQDDL